MISTSATFCPCPWTSLNIDQTGRVLPCLNSHVENLALGNTRQQTIQQVLSGNKLRNLKSTIASGQWHELCTKCRINEQQTGSSARTQMTVDPQVLESIDQDIDFFKLQYLSINWSNLCNLTCTYCSPGASTAWQSTLNLPVRLEKNEHLDLIQLARDNRDHLHGLSLGGGEPLLQKTLPDFLRQLDPQKTRCLVTTNLCVDLTKNPVYQELKKWPLVIWQISFDNVRPEKFEYVRRGCEWSQFLKNIDVLKSDGIKPTAHPAYSIYCAFDLVEYYEFCKRQDLEIFWCELSHPDPLDVKQLPGHLRQRAQQEIDAVLDSWGNHFSLSSDTLRQYRARLNFDHGQSAVTPAQFHARQEQELEQRHKFSELWPLLAF